MTKRLQVALALAAVALLLVIYTVWYQLGVFNAMYQLLGWNLLAVPAAAVVLAFLSVWKD